MRPFQLVLLYTALVHGQDDGLLPLKPMDSDGQGAGRALQWDPWAAGPRLRGSIGAPSEFDANMSTEGMELTTGSLSVDSSFRVEIARGGSDVVPLINDIQSLVRCPSREPAPPLPGKKGACMVLDPNTSSPKTWTINLPKVQSLSPYWNYSWSLKRIQGQPSDMEFAPMAWGAWNLNKFASKLEREVDTAAQRLLGFNEPDMPNQANMTVSKALEAWPFLEAYNLPLVSPSAAYPLGPWLQEFMDKADEQCLRVDWIGVHWYGNPNVSQFQKHLEEVYERYGRRPLLLTEFAVADWQAEDQNRFSPATVLSFMQEVLPWLEATEWIAGYAWFPFEIDFVKGSSSALFRKDGSLTKLGEYYQSVSTDRPSGNGSISS